MNKMTIGIDIDDTVCCLSSEIDVEVLKKYPAVHVLRNEYFLGARYAVHDTKRLHSGIVRKIMYNNVDWANLRPAPGVVKAIKQLQKAGAKIVFITHRSETYTPHVAETTDTWLKKYFSNYETIYARDKIATAENLGCTYLIDNSHSVLLQRPTEVGLIFYTGVQPTINKATGLKPFKTWEEIVKHITNKE